jgi:hypothetical protein
VGTLVPMGFPKVRKPLLPLAGVVFTAINIYALCFERRHQARILLYADSTGFLIGAILYWAAFRILKEPSLDHPAID